MLTFEHLLHLNLGEIDDFDDFLTKIWKFSWENVSKSTSFEIKMGENLEIEDFKMRKKSIFDLEYHFTTTFCKVIRCNHGAKHHKSL